MRIISIALILFGISIHAQAVTPIEPPYFADDVRSGSLPPISDRIPSEPLVVNLADRNREVGKYGGRMRTLIKKAKGIRYMVVYGYARLVGYDENYTLKPDILRDITVEDGRKFTLHLRRGHKWSDGHPFTSSDFRYWWDDIINNPTLTPTGVPNMMLVKSKPPIFSTPDDLSVVYEWDHPNPMFLPALAQARPPFIYRPAHYLKQFHDSHADMSDIEEILKQKKMMNWAQMHNKYDNMYKNDNPKLPTLQPWMNTSKKNKTRYLLTRNPYYHRVDKSGQQLPYIDEVTMTVVASGLVEGKVKAGEVDIQARGLNFSGIAALKKDETEKNYKVKLWANGTASQIALYPNLNYNDPIWRKLLRDKRFRAALSLSIDRRIINRTLYFGLAQETATAAISASPFYNADNSNSFAKYNPEEANKLLDDLGLTNRRGDGIRLLKDGQPLRLVVETAGERSEELDALELIKETWREVGIDINIRQLDRDNLRNRAFAGRSMVTVWTGWDNGIPSALSDPNELAPITQSNLSWPKWGQYYQTKGMNGTKPDTVEAEQLMHLYDDWRYAKDDSGRASVWEQMLQIHAEQIFTIGVVSEAPQPIIVSDRIKNFPEKAIWTWDPGAHFGIYRIDEFFFDDRNNSQVNE